MHNKKLRLLILFILIYLVSSFGAGCERRENPASSQAKFDAYMNDLFKEEVQTDTLSLNYCLANPENYGINYKKTTFGDYSIKRMKENLSEAENHRKKLHEFNFDSLKESQQLTYHIVDKYLKQQLDLGKYLYYSECLGPTTGIQAQLPILLAEYGFYDKGDINNYIGLLSCIDDYFNEIIQFEKEKSAKGLFMSDRVADRIIAQCQAFIATPEENFLISYFNDKINSYNGLTKNEIIAYEKKNRATVLNDVIPAYQNLINALEELKGTGKNDAGLYYYPEGKDYYQCLAQYKTGSSKNMDQMANMLEKAISNGILKITSISLTDSKIMDKYKSFTSFPITDPVKILEDLKSDIKKDFPEAVPVKCKVKYVPNSLSDFVSPAMYLVPPLDNYKNNKIYINGNDDKTLSQIYTTVAHEGYPGHLYQCVYFRNQNPAPIRNVLNFLGYDEGWATYVEEYSYHLAGIDENLASFLEANNSIILCMYARADIGIHYQGWTKAKVISYVTNIISNRKVAEKIYYTLIEEPAIYLPYAIGSLEIKDLRDEAKNKLGSSYNAKDFHEFFLDIGPAQFDIIETYMDQWINNKTKQQHIKNY